MEKLDFSKFGDQKEFENLPEEEKKEVVDEGWNDAEKIKEKAESIEQGLKILSSFISEKLDSIQNEEGHSREEAEKYFCEFENFGRICPRGLGEGRKNRDSFLIYVGSKGDRLIKNRYTRDVFYEKIVDLADYLSKSETLVEAGGLYLSGEFDSSAGHADIEVSIKEDALKKVEEKLHQVKSQKEFNYYNTIIEQIKNNEFFNPSIDEIEKNIAQKEIKFASNHSDKYV